MITIIKKIWTFIKSHWLSILAVIGVVAIIVYGYGVMNSLFNNDTSMAERLQQQEERHIKEIAELNKIANEQLAKQNELNQLYEQEMTDLRAQLQTGLSQIKALQRQRQTQLQNNPTELGNAITATFGIPQGGQ
jgi:DNA anti-recombination protein RmuC